MGLFFWGGLRKVLGKLLDFTFCAGLQQQTAKAMDQQGSSAYQ